MEREQTDYAQAMEQANPCGLSPSELRQGAQPAALLPGQATQPMTLLPKCPWDADKEQGAAVHAAASAVRESLCSPARQGQGTPLPWRERGKETVISELLHLELPKAEEKHFPIRSDGK